MTASRRSHFRLFTRSAPLLAALALVACGGGDPIATAPPAAPVQAAPQFGFGADFVGSRPLNDTGITDQQCYGEGGDALVPCASAAALALSPSQDGHVGRDARPSTNAALGGKLGFNFTKIDGSGNRLPDNAGAWSCVFDNTTGLMWENKQVSGIHAGSLVYTNLGDQSAGDSSTLVNQTRGQALCGSNAWRMPQALELNGLVDYGGGFGSTVKIDANFFANTTATPYWTGTANPIAPTRLSYFVDFGTGVIRSFANTTRIPARLVSGE